MPSRPGMWAGLCHAEYYAEYYADQKRRAYGKNQMRYGHWPINDGADTF